MQTEDTIPQIKQRKSRKHEETPEIQKVAKLPVAANAFGRKYTIKKFSLGQIAQSLIYVGPLQFPVQQIADHDGELSKGQIVNIVLGALSQSGYAMIGLICVATSEPSEWIEEQDDAIGGLEVLTAVVEKNADFFSPENIKRAKGLFARLQAAIPALSGITSTPSSNTDTAL